MSKLYEQYREAIKAAGLTFIEVSRRTGIKYGRMAHYLGGYHDLRDDQLAAIDAVLGKRAPKREGKPAEAIGA